eukprot:scaffold179312_cov18-Tisochrysis_lutea.AAC.2
MGGVCGPEAPPPGRETQFRHQSCPGSNPGVQCQPGIAAADLPGRHSEYGAEQEGEHRDDEVPHKGTHKPLGTGFSNPLGTLMRVLASTPSLGSKQHAGDSRRRKSCLVP